MKFWIKKEAKTKSGTLLSHFFLSLSHCRLSHNKVYRCQELAGISRYFVSRILVLYISNDIKLFRPLAKSTLDRLFA